MFNIFRDTDGKGGVPRTRRRKKRVPTVAMSNEDYKKKRGIINGNEIKKTSTSKDRLIVRNADIMWSSSLVEKGAGRRKFLQ